ncbi:MAG TPA: hypothetical protein VK707_02385 [Solirubrobacteraceae bacterium]|nr:hypothetical protein [Solirubrobacteraceae bacterium]
MVDVMVEGLELAPQACLLDSGANDIRLGKHVADLAGVELTATVEHELVVGGVRTRGRGVEAQLALREGADLHVWTPTVYFCEPWPWAFGLLGLGGLDPFRLIIDAYEEWLELRPIDR